MEVVVAVVVVGYSCLLAGVECRDAVVGLESRIVERALQVGSMAAGLLVVEDVAVRFVARRGADTLDILLYSLGRAVAVPAQAELHSAVVAALCYMVGIEEGDNSVEASLASHC